MRNHLGFALLLFFSLIMPQGCVGGDGGASSSTTGDQSSQSPPEIPPPITPEIHHDPPVVVMLGDSITSLAGDWQARIGLDIVQVLNKGASGRTTDTLRPLAIAAMDAKPEMLFLMVGVNDISDGIPPERAVANYIALLDAIRSTYPYTEIHCQSVLPTSRPEWNAQIVRLNDSLEALCTDKGCEFIDLYPLFLDDDRERIRPDLTVDGVHLTEAGYDIWADALRGHLLP